MNDRPWWITTIQWSTWLLAMTLIMGWLGRSRIRYRRAEKAATLHHPASTLIIGLVCVSFFGALAIYSALTINKTASWFTTTCFGLFALMSLPMLVDFIMARHQLTDDGIRYRKFLGATGLLVWSDICRVKYSFYMKWFILEADSGVTVRISAMLVGLPEFAQALLKRVHHSTMDAPTKRVLEQTAAGNPPQLW